MFAVIYIPDFALQAALRCELELHSRPVALLNQNPAKATIFQLTQSARAAGVREGMTSTQALARCREIIVKTRSAPQERAANETLLQCAYSFSPFIEATADGTCTLDLKGLSHAGDEQWGQKIIALLAQLQLPAQIGVAENPETALLAARCAQPFLAVNNARKFLAELPIESIKPSAELLSILHKWGLHTLGAFTALGQEQITERLGAEAFALFDRASARTTRPLKLASPPEVFEEAKDFENEIESLEPLLFLLRRFLDQISCRLELGFWVAEEITLHLKLSSGAKYERVFRVPAPTCDRDKLFRMLYTHLENLRTDSPIAALYLKAKPCRQQSQQVDLFEATLRDPNQFYETLARLNALLGAERAGTPIVEQTYRPDAFSMQVPDFAHATASDARWISRKATEHAPSFGLPLRKFRPPRPVCVTINEGEPASLKTADWNKAIRAARGPWRTSGHWWDNQRWACDEWDVQTADGELYRLYQQNDHWFLGGIF